MHHLHVRSLAVPMEALFARRALGPRFGPGFMRGPAARRLNLASARGGTPGVLALTMTHMLTLLHLQPELLALVARALLRIDPQADARAVCRFAASSKALRQLVRGDAAEKELVAELQAARAMLTQQRQHELKKAAGLLGEDAALPFDPADYKQVQQLPATGDQYPSLELPVARCRGRGAGSGGGASASGQRLLGIS